MSCEAPDPQWCTRQSVPEPIAGGRDHRDFAARLIAAVNRTVDPEFVLAADAAGSRPVLRFWSALGRAIARISRPFAGLLRRIGTRLIALSLWLTIHAFTPVGRWFAGAGRHADPSQR